jgi:hypothetical protein
VSQHKEQQGFVTFAINTDEVDYLELAYLQALNIKDTQKHNRYAVIVDNKTKELINERHRSVFDYVLDLPVDYNARDTGSNFENEWRVFWLTPFKETIKLESDLLFTRSIDHWWTAFRLKDVCLSTGARNYQDTLSGVRKYRELFDANQLPDVYNGLMYFRYTRTATQFFSTAQDLVIHWDDVRNILKKCHDEYPTTDVVYAIAALVMGEETVTMPSMDFINFVHMKSGFNGWSDARSWLDTVVNERDGDVIRINNLNQYSPVHYHDKTYATRELIEYYESRRTEILG